MYDMIVDNFSRILGERLLRVTKVARDTGISRTTLTNIYYKKSRCISFDVLDKLCDYLNCGTSDIGILEHKIIRRIIKPCDTIAIIMRLSKGANP